MSSVAELVPERFAELIRPAINRVQRSVRDRALTAGSAGLPRRYGMPSARLVDELRYVLPRGPLPTTAFPLAARYEPAEVVQGQVDALVSGGWLVPAAAGLVLGDRTAAYLDDLHALHAEATAVWTGDLSELLDLVGTLLAAGTATGGAAYAVFAPPHERPSDPPGIVLFNRLAALRYHRSDAHVAAWAARGLTADQVATLPADAPLRQEIEADTNRRSAPPYAALSPSRRLRFLAGLATLS